jgi:hypothetical protein
MVEFHSPFEHYGEERNFLPLLVLAQSMFIVFIIPSGSSETHMLIKS